MLVVDGGAVDLRAGPADHHRRSREAGRALVIAFNKWDLVDEERRYYLDREIERDLVQVQWAPRINITARTGWHVDRLVPALDTALEGWETRVRTGALNAFLGRLVAEHPHPVRGGKQPKILFGTQAADRAADVRAVHQRQARGVGTSASSSAGCARSSASSAPRCTCSSARARSASAADALAVGSGWSTWRDPAWSSAVATVTADRTLDQRHRRGVRGAGRVGPGDADRVAGGVRRDRAAQLPPRCSPWCRRWR